MSFPEIEMLLPHRAPMLWIDRVIAREGDRVRCSLTLREDHVFVHDGRVEPLVAIEWMAQALGALVGMIDREHDQNPRPGYLIAIPDGHFYVTHFSVGDVVEIEAARVWGDDQLASFECKVERGALLCATAQLSVYRKALNGSPPA
jgi:predicted hotdog family 3-hydroxylacyl-ACP dehydratase